MVKKKTAKKKPVGKPHTTAKKTERQTLRLLPDVPFGETARGTEDGLGFAQYATILARAALDTPEPFTIGVYGGWGSGKTSLMRMIQNIIREDSGAISVWFNAWRYEKEEHLIVPLLATIITEMDQHEKKFVTNLKTGFTKLRDAFRGILYGVSIKGKVGIPGLSEAELSVSPKDMVDRYEKLSQMATDRILDQSLYFRSFARLDEIAQDATIPKLIIFVDDLDRCFPDKAVALLESVKLVLNQPNITFVLGIAPQIIRAYLSTKYRKEYDIKAELYDDYLDKLVQLPFPIPEIKENVTDYVRSLLRREDVFGKIPPSKFKKEYEPLVSICGPACKDNPRAIIRFLNRLLILTRVHEQKKSEMEISLVHFGITNALQMNWQSIYEACEHDRQICFEPRSEKREYLCTVLKNVFTHFKNDSKRIDRFEEYAKDETNPEKHLFQILSTDESLRKLLSSEPGIKWLNEPRLRKEAAATTEQVKSVTNVDIKGPRQVIPGADEYTSDGWPVFRGIIIKPKANLDSVILIRANLEGVNLEAASLRGARLRGASLRGANLQRADLKGAKLEGANLQEARLEGAQLDRAQLQGAIIVRTILRKAYLQEANLQEANLQRAELEAANLQKANLEAANLEGANLRKAVLQEANLRVAKLQQADLAGANLQKANLEEAQLEGANLQEANLRAANLQKANLEGAKLQKAILQGAKLQKANLQGTHLVGANLQQANLESANLQKANLEGTDLQEARLDLANLAGANLAGANLEGANLRETNLQGANLQQADLARANLQKAIIEGAILRKAYLREANLQGARYNEATIWPEGYDPAAGGAIETDLQEI